MAISHIASIRGSARMSNEQHRIAAAAAAHRDDASETRETGTNDDDQSNEQSEGLLQSSSHPSEQLSTLSLSESSYLNDPTNERQTIQNQIQAPESLKTLTTVTDIDNHFESDQHELATINKLEQRWHDTMKNLDDTIRHLQECGSQVTGASLSCLQSLESNVETVCDKVDINLKAMYHLMTKCDELITKLSIATSFRDEIRTLRKSVDTLEQLYKAKVQFENQRKRTTDSSNSQR